MDSDHEIYPMPLFVQLSVSDLDAAAAWYRDLGFETIFEMPVMAHVRYRKYADVMLAADRTDLEGGRDAGAADATRESRGGGVSVYLTVDDESVDDVAARAADAGIDAAREPYETPWNTREVAFADPDGYEVVFSEPVDVDRSFEDVMGTTQEE